MKNPITMNNLSDTLAAIRRNKLAWNILMIAAIILAMAVAAHFAMQAGTRHGARRRVPDFTGMGLDEALKTARKNNLKIHINDSLFVPAYGGGTVLDQLPEGGVEVKPGRTVYITINAFRQKEVPVPYVAGRSLRQAKNMLEIAGLEIDRIVFRPDIATYYVLEEYCGEQPVTPDSKIETEIGSGITLHVGVKPGDGTTVVPMLVGTTLRQAKSRLWELGLNVGKIESDKGVNQLNQKDARVYLQSPGPEQTAELGSEVALKLTLDGKKTAESKSEAQKMAKQAAEERANMERIQDSIRLIQTEAQGETGWDESPEEVDPDKRLFAMPKESGSEEAVTDEFFN